jgi:hypothetical protein
MQRCVLTRRRSFELARDKDAMRFMASSALACSCAILARRSSSVSSPVIVLAFGFCSSSSVGVSSQLLRSMPCSSSFLERKKLRCSSRAAEGPGESLSGDSSTRSLVAVEGGAGSDGRAVSKERTKGVSIHGISKCCCTLLREDCPLAEVGSLARFRLGDRIGISVFPPLGHRRGILRRGCGECAVEGGWRVGCRLSVIDSGAICMVIFKHTSGSLEAGKERYPGRHDGRWVGLLLTSAIILDSTPSLHSHTSRMPRLLRPAMPAKPAARADPNPV